MSAPLEIGRRFGQNLRLTRKRAGISQEELGIRASLHRTQIGSLERGDHLPRIDTLAKLAGALGVPAGRLMDGITWRAGHALVGGWEAPGGDSAQTETTASRHLDSP